jgi:hypothetical protein
MVIQTFALTMIRIQIRIFVDGLVDYLFLFHLVENFPLVLRRHHSKVEDHNLDLCVALAAWLCYFSTLAQKRYNGHNREIRDSQP